MSNAFPRFGLSEARKTEIRRENRLKQEQYARQKTIQFSNLLERSAEDVDDYVESQDNVFFSNAGGEARRDDDSADFAFDEERASAEVGRARRDDESDPAFVSDDGEIGDDVFSPRFAGAAAFGRGAFADFGADSDGGALEFDPEDRRIESLTDRLLEQIRLDVRFDEPAPENERILRNFCVEIVARLDASGYLIASGFADSLDVDAVASPESRFFDVVFGRRLTSSEREFAVKAFRIVRSLDPPGVGALDMKDALRLRLRPDAPFRVETARLLADDVFDDFCKKRLSNIVAKTGFSREKLEEIFAAPFPFFPAPATLFDAAPTASPIRGEVVVEKNASGRWIVRPDESRETPTLDPQYRKMLLAKNLDAKTREYLRRQYVEARALLDALTSRNATILRVAKAVVDFQNDWLDATADVEIVAAGGLERSDFGETDAASPRPLTQLQIADKIGLDPSTVSRAVAGKWLATPTGFVPFKAFFPKAVSGDATAVEVAAKIRRIIDAEDRAKPLGDAAISERLRTEFGVEISRKTVQERRERLRIPNSRERKRNYR